MINLTEEETQLSKELMHKIKHSHGKDQAMYEFIALHKNRLLRYAISSINKRWEAAEFKKNTVNDAEELVNDTFSKLFININKVDINRNECLGYFFKTFNNEIERLHDKRERMVKKKKYTQTLYTLLSNDEFMQNVHRMPANYKMVILKRLDGLSYNEIVNELKIGLSNVKQLLLRGSQLLERRGTPLTVYKRKKKSNDNT